MGLKRFALAVMHREAGRIAEKLLSGKILRARPGAMKKEVCVWVCVWEYECVWGYVRVRVWLCKSVTVRVWKSMRVCMRMWEYECVWKSVRVCVWVCESTWESVIVCERVWSCECVCEGMWECVWEWESVSVCEWVWRCECLWGYVCEGICLWQNVCENVTVRVCVKDCDCESVKEYNRACVSVSMSVWMYERVYVGNSVRVCVCERI